MNERLRAIARDTVAICDRGWYETKTGRTEIRVVPEQTTLYEPDEPLNLPPQRQELPRVEVTGESTLEAARRLENPAALVFASARNPGGGFLNGARAQEEGIARSSALYPYLLKAGDFYAHHRAHEDLAYSDRVIHSPDVPVFRDDQGDLIEPYTASFLTAAAPNRGAVVRNQPRRAKEIPAILHRRAARVLQVAAANGHTRLVLGAWGCGVFANDPITVSQAFRAAMDENRHFEHIVFAVLGAPNLAAFNESFG
ncbi:TIGR02452 family protein [Kutzneria sp. 744]|uniref:TIGR02452 family protein n=1 Tax=Kutzneria sp. (strain 744) TaxID=345341 RepID=UPI0003EECC0F|nr:TIGR02452 family protein [Kutzneria sp. 744]EWM11623.1 hypothetical protein KUTG_01927 [Kutzneria sp. 744]